MKYLLLTTIAAVVLVGCGPSVDIWEAAEDGNIKAIKQHLAAGADVDAKGGWFGGTPLHYAAHAGHKEIAELLIANGADINAKDMNGMTPLHRATYLGYKEIAELLIAKGADVNVKDDNGKTPLDESIIYNQPEIADILRKDGAKSGAEDSIHVAAWVGNIEAVKQHLAAGVDVNGKGDFFGRTPLLHAVSGGHKEVAELLIAAGADVDAKDNTGWTPLQMAASNGHKEIVELLIAKGADVNVKNNDGYTPLDYAIGGKRSEIIDILRKHGGKFKKELEAAGN